MMRKLECPTSMALAVASFFLSQGIHAETKVKPLPKGQTMTVKLNLTCHVGALSTTGSGSYKVYFDTQGRIFDFDANASDRGVMYIPDSKSHPITKTTVKKFLFSTAEFQAQGQSLATWDGRSLMLQRQTVFNGRIASGDLVESRDAWTTSYSIDADTKECGVIKSFGKTFYRSNGTVDLDTICEGTGESCSLSDGAPLKD
jgi:hypothetical protein